MPAPAADAAGVYCFFPEFWLVVYDLDGRERRRELPPFRSFYGLASSPIVEGGVLVLVCDPINEPFFPSPVTAGGRLYVTSSAGTVAVVSAQAQWETLAVNDLDEPVFASPAIADGRLFVRTRSKLYAFVGK